jgi:hypothetical protein
MLPGKIIMNGITNANDGISDAHFIDWNGANISNASINHRYRWKK